MTLAELRDGADTIADVKRRAAFFQWIETEVESLFGERILEVGTDVLIDWIRLARKLKARGRPKEPADLLIAATARVHDLILVTRNVRDFADTGIVVYDPWHDKTHRMGAP
jgi:predicted nucleic acid-binding protein